MITVCYPEYEMPDGTVSGNHNHICRCLFGHFEIRILKWLSVGLSSRLLIMVIKTASSVARWLSHKAQLHMIVLTYKRVVVVPVAMIRHISCSCSISRSRDCHLWRPASFPIDCMMEAGSEHHKWWSSDYRILRLVVIAGWLPSIWIAIRWPPRCCNGHNYKEWS